MRFPILEIHRVIITSKFCFCSLIGFGCRRSCTIIGVVHGSPFFKININVFRIIIKQGRTDIAKKNIRNFTILTPVVANNLWTRSVFAPSVVLHLNQAYNRRFIINIYFFNDNNIKQRIFYCPRITIF